MVGRNRDSRTAVGSLAAVFVAVLALFAAGAGITAGTPRPGPDAGPGFVAVHAVATVHGVRWVSPRPSRGVPGWYGPDLAGMVAPALVVAALLFLSGVGVPAARRTRTGGPVRLPGVRAPPVAG